MLLHGFNKTFCELIHNCISIAHYSVLINGSPVGFFPGSRGIRQRDPLFPTLFTIVADLLSRLLTRVEINGKINGVRISRTSPRITYLMYADDLVIYCKADRNEALEVKNKLEKIRHTF